MNISFRSFRTHTLARVLGAALLLSAALAASGVTVTLDDGTSTLTCTISTGGSIRATGDITTNVATGCIPTTGGGGTGPFTLTVVRTGNTDALNTVVDAGNGISCPAGTCSASLASTTGVSLTASAGGTGANFIGWSGGGCSGTGTCAFGISAATTVTALFGPLNLTVTPAGTGAGTVTSTPAGTGGGINCTTGSATGCSDAYTAVTSVTLTAAPASGATFAGWSGGCSGTASTCTVSMNASKSVTATFNVASACGALPLNTVVVDTGNLNVAWPQATYLPPPQQITAFKVTVPATFTGRADFAVAGTASATKSKLLLVSTCPGVLTVAGTGACSLAGTETTTVSLSGNAGDASYYCKLTPGATYYVNAVSKNKVTDTSYNCSTTTNCSFYAVRGTPY